MYIVRGDEGIDAGSKCTLTSRQGGELDRLYQDLPVLVIDEWEELTPTFLAEKYKELTSKTYNIEKLYMAYWRAKIEEVRRAFLLSMSLINKQV
jgi:hypothetical protein